MRGARSMFFMDVAFLSIAIGCSLAIYGNYAALHGPLLYDDKAAVLQMPVVTGAAPLEHMWHVDFWGTELASPESHKSWRPLVTLTFAANYAIHGPSPFGYHVVNTALHVVVSAAVLPATRAAIDSGGEVDFSPGLASILFAVHPVHVEAVQNVVGRAELLMSLGYLGGFLTYTCAIGCGSCGTSSDLTRQLAGLLLALSSTLVSTLCKETGVTLPLLCVAWDITVACRLHPLHVVQWAAYLLVLPLCRPGVVRRPPRLAEARKLSYLLIRCGLLTAGGTAISLWRFSRNGGTSPSFNAFANPGICISLLEQNSYLSPLTSLSERRLLESLARQPRCSRTCYTGHSRSPGSGLSTFGSSCGHRL